MRLRAAQKFLKDGDKVVVVVDDGGRGGRWWWWWWQLVMVVAVGCDGGWCMKCVYRLEDQTCNLQTKSSHASETTKEVPEKNSTQPNSQLFLDVLDVGVSGTIVVMVCRKWDVNATSGRYLSTDFIVSDGRGNIMHCTAKASVSHNFVNKLKDGVIYSIKDFSVVANKDEYRVLKDSACMIEFDGATSVRKAAVKADGFVRHPFQLVPFEKLEPTGNKFLIDVIGYVTNVGRTTYQRTGSRNLDFYLANQSGQSIRVTLWGGLGDILIEKKAKQSGLCAVVLTSVNARHYNNKLYLSSSSSTLILDDDDIPALIQFKAGVSSLNQKREVVPADHSIPKPGTLENVLMWARNRRNDSSTFHCKVRINNVITRKGWNYPSCGGDKCKKGLTRQGGKFWCEGCSTSVDYPVVRYRLELGVSDETDQTVVVMFDETATEVVKHSAASLFGTEAEDLEDQVVLPRAIADIVGGTYILEIKTHTYYEHGSYESFTCSAICPDEPVDEGTSSSTVDQTAASDTNPIDPSEEKPIERGDVEQSDTEIDEDKPGLSAAAEKRRLKKLSNDPSVCTPSKPTEGRIIKRDELEDSDTEINEVVKKRSVVVEDSDNERDQDIKKKAVGHPKKKVKKMVVVAASDEE